MLRKKTQPNYAESLMTVDRRGHLVLDKTAMLQSGVMTRQFDAANRLYENLQKRKTQRNLK